MLNGQHKFQGSLTPWGAPGPGLVPRESKFLQILVVEHSWTLLSAATFPAAVLWLYPSSIRTKRCHSIYHCKYLYKHCGLLFLTYPTLSYKSNPFHSISEICPMLFSSSRRILLMSPIKAAQLRSPRMWSHLLNDNTKKNRKTSLLSSHELQSWVSGKLLKQNMKRT